MRVDSRLKIIDLLLLAAASFMPVTTWAMAAMAVALVVASFIRLGARTATRTLVSILPVLVIMTLLSPLSHRDGDVLWWILTRQAVDSLVVVSSRFLILTFAFALLIGTTEDADLVLALQGFGVPYRAGLTVSLILRFLPQMSHTFTQISESHMLRGRRRRFSETIGSLVSALVMALRSIPLTAMALEQRGLGRGGKPTSYHSLPPFRRSIAVLAVSVLVLAGYCYVFRA